MAQQNPNQGQPEQPGREQGDDQRRRDPNQQPQQPGQSGQENEDSDESQRQSGRR